jgi:hypothetical protein
MARIQPCRNGCDTEIVVQMDEESGKWKPYEYNEETDEWDQLHDCPKSPYKQGQQGGGGGKQFFTKKPQQQPQQATARPQQQNSGLEALLLQQISSQVTKNSQDLKEIKELIQQNTQIDTTKLIGQMQAIHDVIAPVLGTNFKIAKELQEDQTKQQGQQQQPEVRGWNSTTASATDQYVSAKSDDTDEVLDEDATLEKEGI